MAQQMASHGDIPHRVKRTLRRGEPGKGAVSEMGWGYLNRSQTQESRWQKARGLVGTSAVCHQRPSLLIVSFNDLI